MEEDGCRGKTRDHAGNITVITDTNYSHLTCSAVFVFQYTYITTYVYQPPVLFPPLLQL